MSTANLIRCSPVATNFSFTSDRSPAVPPSVDFSHASSFSSQNGLLNQCLALPRRQPVVVVSEKFVPSCSGGDGNYGAGYGGNGGEGGGDGFGDEESKGGNDSWGILGLFLNGWRSRVAADPQFPFKVLMEELVGVSSCVLGDMASRPNFGLNELDFVFSTLVVGCILNFTLMYLLAPTLGGSASNLPAIFANCPQSHMFEPGAFSIMHRLGTFVYKGTIFAMAFFLRRAVVPSRSVVPRRYMSHDDPKELEKGIKLWKQATIGGTLFCLAWTAWEFSHHHEEHAPSKTAPSVHIRRKPLPWGDGKTDAFDFLAGKSSSDAHH